MTISKSLITKLSPHVPTPSLPHLPRRTTPQKTPPPTPHSIAINQKTIKEIAYVNEKISDLTIIANNGPLSTSHEQTLEKLIRENEKERSEATCLIIILGLVRLD